MQYWIGLSDISSITPIERETDSTWSWPHRLRKRTGIFSISVPSPVSDITRAELRGLKDLQKAGGSKFSRCAYGIPPSKVWLLGIEEVEGTEVETMLYICWWTDEEMEKDFKNCVTPPGETRTRLDKFLANARSAGAAYIVEEHCDFRHIYIYN